MACQYPIIIVNIRLLFVPSFAHLLVRSLGFSVFLLFIFSTVPSLIYFFLRSFVSSFFHLFARLLIHSVGPSTLLFRPIDSLLVSQWIHSMSSSFFQFVRSHTPGGICGYPTYFTYPMLAGSASWSVSTLSKLRCAGHDVRGSPGI